jgi:hypothetical protein
MDKPGDFRAAVIADVWGKPNLSLRTPDFSELWLAELLGIRDENFIQQVRREDAVRMQGSMNRGNALAIGQDQLDRLLEFETKLNIRIGEAKQLVEAHRLIPYKVETNGLVGSFTFSEFTKQNFLALKSEYSRLRHKYSITLAALRKLQKIFDKAYQKQERLSVDTYRESIEQHRTAIEKLKAANETLSTERNEQRILLFQLVMRWDDMELDDDFLDELKSYLGYDLPIGVTPLQQKALRKAAGENDGPGLTAMNTYEISDD